MKTDRVFRYTLLFFTAIALSYIYLYNNPENIKLFPKCPIMLVTGVMCPGCGSQRALHYLINLNLRGALEANTLMVASIPYLFTGFTFNAFRSNSYAYLRWRRLLFGRGAIIVILVVITLFTVLRNQPLFLSCRSQNEPKDELPLIDLTADIPEALLNGNDLASNISIAALETTESSLVREFSGFVGERYIIVLDTREMLLFNSGGSFICRIASRGRAPDEFNSIEAWDVDEQENFFYYYDRGRDYISKYDLNKRQAAEPVPLPAEVTPDKFIVINDTLLAILPSIFSQSGYLLLYINHHGTITSSVETEPVPQPGAWAGRSQIFTRSGSGAIAWLHPEIDTLFSVKGTDISPRLLFKGTKPHTHGNVTTVTNWYVDGISEQHISIRQVSYEKIEEPGNVSISYSDDEPEHFFWYRERQSLYKIAGYSLRLGEVTIKLPRLETGIHGNIYCIMSPTEFKEALEKATGGEVTESQLPEAVINLYKKLSPFDNPVIISARNLKFDSLTR